MSGNVGRTEDREVKPQHDKAPGPLSGAVVVEFGRFVTAPYAARLLADAGATVIKLETGTGDPFRGFSGDDALSAQFVALNRNKKSVVLDLDSVEGRTAAVAVAAGADVFIENSRPGRMRRYGLDYQSLAEKNPRLVYCSISGAGTSGFYAQRPAYDTVGQALGGMMSQFVDPSDPRVVGPNLSDSLTGLMAAQGVLMALYRRFGTGVGDLIEVNMVHSAVAFLGAEAQIYLDTGAVPGPFTRPANSTSFVFRCGDGLLLGVHLSSVEKFWSGMLAAVARADLAADARFATRAGRIANYEMLRLELQPVFAARSRADWLQTLTELDVPCAPVHTISDALRDPELAPLNLLVEARSADGGTHPTVSSPLAFTNSPVGHMAAAPELGADTDAVLAHYGIESRASADSAVGR